MKREYTDKELKKYEKKVLKAIAQTDHIIPIHMDSFFDNLLAAAEFLTVKELAQMIRDRF